MAIASLPKASTASYIRSTPGEARRICGEKTYFYNDSYNDDCLVRESGSWRQRAAKERPDTSGMTHQ